MAADRVANTKLKNIVKQVNPFTVFPTNNKILIAINTVPSASNKSGNRSNIITTPTTIIADTGATGHYLMAHTLMPNQ